jgi:glucose-1-phosphate cytidylyltransferase
VNKENLVRAVILAGGMGTRLREETEYRPKPMVEIGGRPILWHIMKNLAQQGLTDFVVCLGYKGDQIRDFFINYESRINDVTVQLGKSGTSIIHGRSLEEEWRITLADTGLETMTGGRLNAVKKYLDGERFLCTYGDGLANIDIQSLLSFHTSHGKIATVTAVRPITRFGALEIANSNQVLSFSEKPRAEKWINGGFFIFEPEIFNYLNKDSILEREPLERVAHEGQLIAFKHEGFWQPMDTYREMQDLNSMWDTNRAPWRNW